MTDDLFLYVDGGVLGGGNPGTGVYWSVAEDWPVLLQTAILVRRRESAQHHTNNEAEYLAIISALDILLDRLSKEQVQASWARIHSDSKLVVEQIYGNWQCKEAHLRPLLYEARDKIRRCREQGLNIQLVHVPRAENVRRLGH